MAVSYFVRFMTCVLLCVTYVAYPALYDWVHKQLTVFKICRLQLHLHRYCAQEKLSTSVDCVVFSDGTGIVLGINCPHLLIVLCCLTELVLCSEEIVHIC